MMRKAFIFLLFFTAVLPLAAQINDMITPANDIQLISLGDSVFIHVTWHQSDENRWFASNGLIIIRNGEALMIDTPMDNDKTERLTILIRDSLASDVVKLIGGHFHGDCLGGLGYLKSIGVESVANSRTVEKCVELGLPVPSISFTDSLNFDFNGETIECHFFGGGHSFDNITVWLPDEKILFGGCLIKSNDAESLGNLSDAVVYEWSMTVKKIMERCRDIEIVIPGHGLYGGPELLLHTIELVESYENK